MADVDPALRQEILDIAQRQRVSHIHHHHQANDFWRAVENTGMGCSWLQATTGKAQEIGLAEPRHLLRSHMHYYNGARTHQKDAPIPRAVQVVGRILPTPILGGLQHQYVRI
jgi:hypothetical protein